MNEWRRTAKIVFATAAVTSVVWLTAGAVMLQRCQPGASGALPMVGAQSLASASRRPDPAATPWPEPAPRVPGAPPGRLLIPVAGVGADQLVDTFTQARADGARVHDAIDIMAPRGTAVLAAAPGRVEKLFVSKQGGNTIYQRSTDGRLIYYYAHLDAYAPGLAEGQPLRAGQTIATVGITGNADPAGPHLHFAIQQTTPGAKWYEPSTPLNPYPLLTLRHR